VGCFFTSEERTGRGHSPPSPLLAVPNVRAHPSVAMVPITVLLYNGPLLCDFNVLMKGVITAALRKNTTSTLEFAFWHSYRLCGACVWCFADPPGKPGRPEVVDYDKDRAEIKWTHPKNDGGSPLTKYVVEKKMKGGMWEKVCRCIYSE